ncbi:beta-galactosidase [Vigna unguiculata]|uniref:Beta-galactosidase n=1 Tax=Vigna unguiculata TaxID=3917 RepID=A0A4D6L4A3_VIGUN|nr:beta-galactosidase [Vigna unguiculata]
MLKKMLRSSSSRGGLGNNMKEMIVAMIFLCVCLVTIEYGVRVTEAEEYFKPFNVTYDHRALILDGKRRMLISAGIHYPRATPEMWPDLIAKSKEGGADVIETYVFWNGHEPVRGQYNFEGRYDLVKFVKLAAAHGLYFFLRIGPYACAEWNFGGFPVWLRDIPGIEFRTNNEPFKEEMKRFVSKLVNMMREEMLFSWQGGPIILLQIENEYGNIESSYGKGGKEYVKWAAKMALSLGAGVPWVMCRQQDAPYDIIDTCNAYYCDGFKPNSPNKPTIWTENWDGWYTQWGEKLPHRPVEDLAFAVARFFQRGGSFQNYYMYFGGTNFGRTAGGPLQITSYDYDAPIDEYGLLHEPKWGHLKDLHTALKLCEPALVSANSPTYIKLGPKQEAHIYQANVHPDGLNLSFFESPSICSAFLANIDEKREATVTFRGRRYTIPPWSVSVLPDCTNTVFNTAKVGAQTSVKLVEFDLPTVSNIFPAQQSSHRNGIYYLSKSWMTTKEPLDIWSKSSFTVEGIWEHLNVTKDQSDYLWYSTRISVSDSDILFWEENDVRPKLTIDGVRDILRVFVNGQLIGNAVGQWIKVVQSLQFLPGYNDLTLLTQTVGLQNYGAFIEKDGAGIRGTIKITGFKNGDIDLSKSLWTHQVGLQGEFLKFYSEENENSEWVELTPEGIPSTFTWYKAYFDVPGGLDPVALDLKSMGKGQAWVNGHHIGRYWTRVSPKSGCKQVCDYRGAYDSDKCTTNCGKPTQTLYHVPRSWLRASNNLLVILEETGGNPFEISVKVHLSRIICAQVSESNYPPVQKLVNADLIGEEVSANNMIPELQLYCQEGHTISSITFASFGNPRGSCQNFSRGNCHAPSSMSIVSKECQGKNRCSIKILDTVFGGDPCPGVEKTLSVEARCTSLLSATLFQEAVSSS